MAYGYEKLDSVIRSNSTATLAQVVTSLTTTLNTLQEKPANKNATGGYISYFMADIFDSRSKSLYRLFGDAMMTKFVIPDRYYTLIDGTKATTSTNSGEAGGSVTMIVNDLGVIF